MAVGLAEATDEQILRRARVEQRIVVTAALDYPRLLALTGAEAPGVILFRGGSFSEAEMPALLERALHAVDEAELAYSFVVVDHRRIRQRRLPLQQQ